MPAQNKGQHLQREVQYFMKPTHQNNQNVNLGQKNIGLQKKASSQMTAEEENKNTAFRKLF